MKKILVFLLLVTLLLAACQTPTVKGVVDADERVQSYLDVFSDATYTESAFKGAEVDAIKDVVLQDCGKMEVPSQLIRATYTSPVASLAAYVDNNEVLCVASKLNQEAFEITQGDPATVDEGTLATVNGEVITTQALQAAVDAVPEAAREQTSIPALLNTLVDQELLRQASADVEVSDDELADAVQQAWLAAGFADEAAFIASLEEQGVTYDEFMDSARSQLQLQKLLVEEGVTDVEVTEEAVRDFYVQNTNAFIVSEQVRFRQLFLGFEQSGGEEAAEARLRNVLQQVNEGLDFCDAVRRYSDDTDSKERCGEYIAARGVLTPEIEASLFALEAEQSTVTASANGYHIFVVLEKQPTQVIPYDQAAQQVANLLQNQVMQQRLNIYLLKLRAEADIVDYT